MGKEHKFFNVLAFSGLYSGSASAPFPSLTLSDGRVMAIGVGSIRM